MTNSLRKSDIIGMEISPSSVVPIEMPSRESSNQESPNQEQNKLRLKVYGSGYTYRLDHFITDTHNRVLCFCKGFIQDLRACQKASRNEPAEIAEIRKFCRENGVNSKYRDHLDAAPENAYDDGADPISERTRNTIFATMQSLENPSQSSRDADQQPLSLRNTEYPQSKRSGQVATDEQPPLSLRNTEYSPFPPNSGVALTQSEAAGVQNHQYEKAE